MFWRKKRPSKATLGFLESQQKFYNDQLNSLKWFRMEGTGYISPKTLRGMEELLPSIVEVIRSHGVEPVFDVETGEIIKLEW